MGPIPYVKAWLWPFIGVVLGSIAVLAIWSFTAESPTRQFERSAARLGLTDAVRIDIRQQFQNALLAMEADVCDEGLRENAGRAAVLYYETLLEKPVVEGGLTMTYDSRCQPRSDKNGGAVELLLLQRGLGKNLVLPWACMPDHWRTPLDRARQAKLEASISSGRLTSKSLSGTLAVIARPAKLNSIRAACTKPSSFGPPQQYPLLAGPNDIPAPTRRRSYGPAFTR